MDKNFYDKYDLLLELTSTDNINDIKNLLDKNYIDGLPLKEIKNFIVTPLKSAIESNKYNMVKFLLESGANINNLSNWIYGYNTPIEHAIIKAMDSYNSYGTPSREIEIIKLLLSYNCDTHILDDQYRTALDVAIEFKHYEAIELIKDYHGKTLEEFDNDNYIKSIEYKKLLDSCTSSYGILELNNNDKKLYLADNLSNENINGISFHKTNYLNTPLNYAIDSFNYELIKYLLEKGANPNLECLWKYGYYSSLFVFIFSSYNQQNYLDEEDIYKILFLLLDLGANINLIDKTYNETPLDVALFLNYEIMINTLKLLGGKTSS